MKYDKKDDNSFPTWCNGTLTAENPEVLKAISKAKVMADREDKTTVIWMKPNGGIFIAFNEDGPLMGCALVWTSGDGFCV